MLRLKVSDALLGPLLSSNLLQVWDLRTRKLKVDLPGHADEVGWGRGGWALYDIACCLDASDHHCCDCMAHVCLALACTGCRVYFPFYNVTACSPPPPALFFLPPGVLC
jgi:hypothetical protein